MVPEVSLLPYGKSLEIPRGVMGGGGVGGEVQNQKPFVGRVWIFSGTTH